MRTMKDSGIEWIGKIPVDWTLQRGKTIFAQRLTKGNQSEILLAATQKYGMLPQSEVEGVVQIKEDADLQQFRTVHKKDFVISLRSFQGGLEISYIPGCITWHYIVLKPKAGVEPEYFKWLFKSPRYVQALQRTANFIRDGQDLRFSNFVQVPLPLIPMDEQKDIAEYLNKETARIDSIIADITEQIEKLKEYRQSVISEVVTGKVAVE